MRLAQTFFLNFRGPILYSTTGFFGPAVGPNELQILQWTTGESSGLLLKISPSRFVLGLFGPAKDANGLSQGHGWSDVFLLHLYPGFYSYTEGATWRILDLLTETLLI